MLGARAAGGKRRRRPLPDINRALTSTKVLVNNRTHAVDPLVVDEEFLLCFTGAVCFSTADVKLGELF
jgi:hypothetical protein